MQKKTIVVFVVLTGKNGGFVRAKKYLAGHHDQRPAVRYFEP